MVIFSDIVAANSVLSPGQIQAARLRKENDRKLQAMISEVVWQVIFLVLLLWVVVGNQDGNVYLQNQDLRNTFISDVEDVILLLF